MKADGIELTDLPDSLQPVAEVIGLEPVLTIVSTWGGRQLYVPVRIDDSHIIAHAIGLEAASNLSSVYGGDTIDVPMGTCIGRARRDRQIAKDLKNGVGVSEVALKYSLGRRQVAKIKRRHFKVLGTGTPEHAHRV